MAEGSNLKRKHETQSEGKPSGSAKKFHGHFSLGLLASMNDPDLIVKSDDQVVIIKDKYPKAKHHFLAMPKENIPNLKSLKEDHLELLKHIDKKGKELAQSTDKTLRFRYGYHAIPSMSHLHMHIISQDFDSPCLKTKKHWNSFTTEYFVDSEDIIRMLEKHGKIQLDSSDFQTLLKEDLKCHVCKRPQKNIPTLKEHIKRHSYMVD